MSDPPPLIVTADLDEVGFNWFENLRQADFPSHRNKVPAHLTLFHALPGEHEQDIARTLQTACRIRRSHSLDAHAPRSLGRGVADRLASPDLEQLHGELAACSHPG